jgi:hypothetical protein
MPPDDKFMEKIGLRRIKTLRGMAFLNYYRLLGAPCRGMEIPDIGCPGTHEVYYRAIRGEWKEVVLLNAGLGTWNVYVVEGVACLHG